MKAQSASTHAADPYRAGLELGDALGTIDPEVVFLFTTMEYGRSTDILDGLHDGLDREGVKVIGSSGDGCYESAGVGTFGASALALTSQGAMEWEVFTCAGLASDPAARAREILARAQAGRLPAFVYLVSDFRTDVSRIDEALREQNRVPVVGGLAADDDRLSESVLYVDREIRSDGIAVLAGYGPLSLSIHVGHGLTPVGPWGTVDDAEGTVVRRIDGIDAAEFIERATGKPVLRSDRGVLSFRVADTEPTDLERIRSVVPDFDGPDATMRLLAGIRVGQRVQVCVADQERVQAEVSALVRRARDDGLEPAAALLVSCAGRKWFLGNQIQHEVTAVQEAFGEGLPIAGFASFGEIGPHARAPDHTANAFHNVTYVLTLIGA